MKDEQPVDYEYEELQDDDGGFLMIGVAVMALCGFLVGMFVCWLFS